MWADGAEDSKGEDPPAGTDSDPEADEAKDNKLVEDNLFHLGDFLDGMQALQARMDKDGMTASRFMVQAGEPKDWVNEYKTLVTLTREEEGRALEAALAPKASNCTYLAIVNKEGNFGVFHGLRHWTTGTRGVNKGKIVPFEGEVWADHQAPYLWCFKEDNKDKFCLVALPDVSFRAAVKYYGHVANRNHFWKDVAPDPKTEKWIGQLIPVPIECAPFFLGYPDLGTTFRRALELVASVKKAEQEKFRGFALSIMFACCSDANQKKAVRALSTHWKHLQRTKTNSAWAANACQEGANPALPIMLPPSLQADMTPRDNFASFFENRQQAEVTSSKYSHHEYFALHQKKSHYAKAQDPPPAGQHASSDTRAWKDRAGADGKVRGRANNKRHVHGGHWDPHQDNDECPGSSPGGVNDCQQHQLHCLPHGDCKGNDGKGHG